MRPIRDAWGWVTKKVSDHPGATAGAVIGGVIGAPLGPLGIGGLGSIGATVGNILDQPKPSEPK